MPNLALWLLLLAAAPNGSEAIAPPQVHDPRLKIELFAAEPDIVTPCGLAVDARGRVLVVESHTHFRPPNYQGPPADRIRLFEDTNGDGRADRIGTFFEGTTWTMNVGVHPDGSVYVATRGEIFRLRDRDGDGRADERTPIVRLETAGDYPHNGLSGFAFDFDGNVYFGLGENKGAEFKLIGTDGSMASELEGGQVYRCRADGSRLEMLAFGFWNPFHLAIDPFGRLFAVDNDPDSLPPCRLLHIVPGGNYGYRYRNGRKGVHPFTAWNGELPGTLPMVSGTGEAPSGIVAYESDGLPADYVGQLLSTSWGDHRIEAFAPEARGASFQATPRTIVSGDENFRPVGIAVAPDGSLFVSDWVLRSYDVHGKGRVWRISALNRPTAKRPTEPNEAIHAAHRPLREEAARKFAADGPTGRAELEKLLKSDASPRVRAVAIEALRAVDATAPLRAAAEGDSHPGVRALALRSLPAGKLPVEWFDAAQPAEVRGEALRVLSDPTQADLAWRHVADPDAFVAAAARRGLARLGVVKPEINLQSLTPQQRLAALLILREQGGPDGRRAVRGFLQDSDAAVRFAAIQWVGEERLTDLRSELEVALGAGPATARLFGGYLAALERLEGVSREASNEWAGQQYIARALQDPQTSPEVRRWALRMLESNHPSLSLEQLKKYLSDSNLELQLEAVRSLRELRDPARKALLKTLALDAQKPARLRAEATVGLTGDEANELSTLLDLAEDRETSVRAEALRSLRGLTLDESQRDRLVKLRSKFAELGELIDRVLQPPPEQGPTKRTLEQWLGLLNPPGKTPGDAESGERVFFHAKAAGCARCHQVAGRGASIGPDLTASAGALTRERLIGSIVSPSKEVAPHFAAWQIVTSEGKSLVGMLVKEEPTGEQTYVDSEGNRLTLRAAEIEQRRPHPLSIMPEGLPERMTLGEFRDLLAFLSQSAMRE